MKLRRFLCIALRSRLQTSAHAPVCRSDVYLKFAWGLTSEYLSGELSAALRRRLQLPDERPKRSQPAAEPPAKRARGAAQPAAPLEDYSRPAANGKKVHRPIPWFGLLPAQSSLVRNCWFSALFRFHDRCLRLFVVCLCLAFVYSVGHFGCNCSTCAFLAGSCASERQTEGTGQVGHRYKEHRVVFQEEVVDVREVWWPSSHPRSIGRTAQKYVKCLGLLALVMCKYSDFNICSFDCYNINSCFGTIFYILAMKGINVTHHQRHH